MSAEDMPLTDTNDMWPEGTYKYLPNAEIESQEIMKEQI